MKAYLIEYGDLAETSTNVAKEGDVDKAIMSYNLGNDDYLAIKSMEAPDFAYNLHYRILEVAEEMTEELNYMKVAAQANADADIDTMAFI